MKKSLIPAMLFLASFALFWAEETDTYVADTDPLVRWKLEQWRDLKFGLLMHWGPYSQWGVVESWSICAEDEDWCRRNLDDYNEYKKRYENLYTTFNPVKFDPAKWAEAAKNAGMKYLVFTTKHHDGFCMWDTRQTGYRITAPECPFSRDPRADVTAEIFKAFRSRGLWIGAYFSKPDWHSEYYWWPNFATPDRNVNYDIGKYPERWNKFVAFTHAQIDELMSSYGRIDILWLDGGWVQPRPGTEPAVLPAIPEGYRLVRLQDQDIRMPEIVRLARSKQPGLIVVDRAVPGPYQNYLTPENTVPEGMLPYPWESCIIMGGGWSYSPGAKMKPARELIHLLVDIVAKGGNLLLNIGPGPDGTWYDEAYERLAEIGLWLKTNGPAIYATRPQSPFRAGKICLTQDKAGVRYAVYLAAGAEAMPAEVFVPVACRKGAAVSMLGARQKLRWMRVDGGIRVVLPEELRRSPPCRYAWTLRIGK